MMANLRGGTFDKQAKDAFHRLAKFRETRYGTNDHFTHSVALAQKREMYLRDFREFLEQNKYTGKMNTWLGDRSTITEFMQNRLDGVSRKTAIDYISGFSSMLKGLKEANITISDSGFRAIEEMRDVAKQIEKTDRRVDRAIENINSVINSLYSRNFGSGVLAEVQYQLGFRTSEAYELVQNFQKYHQNGVISGLKGKGNHIYIEKKIDKDLATRIKAVTELPNHDQYLKNIKEVTNNNKAVAHDFRYTFAKQKYKELKRQGKTEKQALREVSRELNHHRESITKYYLKGA
jgi:cell fate (sporulation/competence/biofilm development) regulator YlbF (YheA/YmcA/DUF963 family)